MRRLTIEYYIHSIMWAVLLMLASASQGAVVADLSYLIDANLGEVTVTGCDTNASGELIIPDQIEGNDVVSIGSLAFSQCQLLTQIQLPAGVQHISDSAFKDCTALQRVILPANLTSIGESAFKGCITLQEITFPSSLTSIGDEAFYTSGLKLGIFMGDAPTLGISVFKYSSFIAYYEDSATGFATGWSFKSSLHSGYWGIEDLGASISIIHYPEFFSGIVNVPSTINGKLVQQIGTSAFAYCDLITEISLPSSIQLLEASSFHQCNSLLNINVQNGNLDYVSVDGVLFDSTRSTLIKFPNGRSGSYVIPLAVTHIDDFAFSYAKLLSQVIIPEGVTTIGSLAFSTCQLLTAITIPSSVSSIGDRAFATCTLLQVVSMAGDTPLMGVDVFQSAHDSLIIHYEPGATGYSESWHSYRAYLHLGLFAYKNTGSSIEIVNHPRDGSSTLTIPHSIDGLPVTSIGPSAFSGSSSLNSVSFPPELLSVGQAAFASCVTLNEISIPDGVQIIGDHAFDYCTSLSSIHLPRNITNIGAHAFESCSSLENISLPQGLLSIGDWAFQFSGLIELNLPDSLQYLGNGAFFFAKLTEIHIAGGITEVKYSTFASCFDLEAVYLPDSITHIGNVAFSNCRALRRISLPSSLIEIGEGAFGHCGNLENINLPDDLEIIGSNAFHGCSSITSIVFPASLISLGYRSGDCSNLAAALFKGNAPSGEWNMFENAHDDFKVYYYEGATGFTFEEPSSPIDLPSGPVVIFLPVDPLRLPTSTWWGYELVEIDLLQHPHSEWLILNDQPYDADLNDDLNNDSIPLLLAYALNLDPDATLGGRMPIAELELSTLEISFYANRSDLTYTVKTSSSLNQDDWSSDGVTLSPLDDDGICTASVQLEGVNQFLRLEVEL